LTKTLRTIPQVLGVQKSKIVGYVLLLIVVSLEFLKENFSISEMYVLVIVSIVIALFLTFSSPKKTRYYTSFWVEAIPIVWLVLIVLFLKN